MNTNHENHVIPGLGTVVIRTDHFGLTGLVISLDPNYTGDLRSWERINGLPTSVYCIIQRDNDLRDAHFTRFLEVMTHWDHDHDGQFDCDALIKRIDDLFVFWEANPPAFRRPDSNFLARGLMKIMPPQPIRHITYNFGELKPHFRRQHYLIAIPSLLMVIGLINLQNWLIPFTKYSPLSAWAWLAETIGFIWAWVLLVAVITINHLVRKNKKQEARSMGRHTFGLLNKAAVYEEQAFREGAENWTRWQRIKSHFAFGAIHQGNLFYPLSTILPLAIGGALLTNVYLRTLRKTGFRRSAVLEASLAHRVYNRMALITVVLVMVTLISSLLISSLLAFLTFFITHILVGLVIQPVNYLPRRFNNPSRVTVRG